MIIQASEISLMLLSDVPPPIFEWTPGNHVCLSFLRSGFVDGSGDSQIVGENGERHSSRARA